MSVILPPRMLDSVEVGNRPLGVSVSPDGQTLVLATRTPGTPITFVSFSDGAFGEARQFAFENLSEMPELRDRGQFPHQGEWHPTEDAVAVTFNLRNQVRFYRVDREGEGTVSGIAQWGNPIVTTKWPMSGKFSRDGRHFVTNDLKWGPDLGPDRNGTYAPPSQLTSIRLGPIDDDAPRHFIAGGVSVPPHAESMAFSNRGDLIVTLNLGQTWLDETEPGHSLSSLTLVAFDAPSGQLRHIDHFPMEGILPEGVSFDAADNWVVAGVYEYEGPEPRDAALEYWRVHRTPGHLPTLVRSRHQVETGPGAHSLIVVNN